MTHRTYSVHLPDELVDVGFPVTEVTTLDVVLELACPPAAGGVGELEWPEEVGCLGLTLESKKNKVPDGRFAHLLEVGPGGENLVNEILNGEDIVQLEGLLDDTVVGERDALLVDLAVSTLVDQLANRLQIRLAELSSAPGPAK